MSGLVAGWVAALSLISAIGVQNAFVLKQGFRREHVFILCSVCATSDTLLVMVGVFGFAEVTRIIPAVEPFARYGGALFLFGYGATCFWRARQSRPPATGQTQPTGYAVVLTGLAYTWLNPHVYLDTVVLLGAISTQYPDEKIVFAMGASLASFTFFYSLGYGARWLTRVFARPRAWDCLEVCIGGLMWGIAWQLL